VPSNDERQRARELRDRAREMRANPTSAERRLWSMLRDRRMPSFKFKRQHVIAPYIVDFACLERFLIIEADGGQHAESVSDERRDAYLRSKGFRVLRFWNNDVLENPSGVFEMICAALHTPHRPTAAQWAPPSPHEGRGAGESHG
jgi:very-short-patch-repair endonuclease